MDAITVERAYQIMRDISHCHQCGQCCTKSDGIELDEHDLALISLRLKKSIPRMLQDHVIPKPGTKIFLLKNVVPCEFLVGGKCSIYDIRPTGCRRYPFDSIDLDNPRVLQRKGCAMALEGFVKFKKVNAHLSICRLCGSKGPMYCDKGIEILTGDLNDNPNQEVQTTSPV